MAKNVQLKVDEPCSADWGRMRAEDQGRFCGSCQKTVVDFTLMTDQQVLDWLARPKDFTSKDATPGAPTCGRFTPDQLNRELVSARQPNRLKLWQWLLAGLLLSTEAQAQTKPANPPIVQRDTTGLGELIMGKMAALPHPLTLPDTLRGRLVDMATGQPAAYATITTSARHRVAADAEGRFAIPSSSIAGKHLNISCIGYNPIVLDIEKTWKNNKEQVIAIPMTETVMGDMVVLVGTYKPVKKQESLFTDTLNTLKDTLAFTGLTKKALTVYPNPVVGGTSVALSLRLDEQGTYTAQLFNTAGVLEETMEVAADQRSKTVLMTIPPTAVPGTYFIRLSNPALRKPYTQALVVL
jgi:hypothetical protein